MSVFQKVAYRSRIVRRKGIWYPSLDLKCGFLVKIKLPYRYSQSNNVQASSNQAVKGVGSESFVHIRHIILNFFVVLSNGNVFDESRTFNVEEDAHEQ